MMSKGERLRRERRLADQASLEQAALAQERRKVARERGAAEGERRGCLFCRRKDTSFTSEEHIFPEGLGNTEHVLPIGVVCDVCNNGVLSRLDEALQSFFPIEVLRTLHGIPSKAGVLPISRFDNGELRCLSPGELKISLDSAKNQPKTERLSQSQVKTGFTALRSPGGPQQLRGVHRALLKIALEYVWVDFGEARALAAEFDYVRNRVLRGGYAGYLAFPQKSNPCETLHFQYALDTRSTDGRLVVGLLARFWGFPLFTDSLSTGPVRDVPAEIIVHPFPAVRPDQLAA
jgi:hypothetical protein